MGVDGGRGVVSVYRALESHHPCWGQSSQWSCYKVTHWYSLVNFVRTSTVVRALGGGINLLPREDILVIRTAGTLGNWSHGVCGQEAERGQEVEPG